MAVSLFVCLTRSGRVTAEAASLGGTHVHFPSTSGQVEEERYFEFPERLEVLAEAFAWKLFEGILIALRRLLHLPLLFYRHKDDTYRPFTLKLSRNPEADLGYFKTNLVNSHRRSRDNKV